MMPATRQHLGLVALDYARRGWHVFPVHNPRPDGACSCGNRNCKNVGKHPRTKNGLKDATDNETLVRRWWGQWPDANIGVATGIESGFIVLDVDAGKGGKETLTNLELEHGILPATPRSKTGGGGWHIFFVHPGQRVPNSEGKVGRGLDVRGDGGYIVAPESLHHSGRIYEWMTSPDDEYLADMPDWLLERTVERHPPTIGTGASRNNGHDALSNREIAYASAALAREISAVVSAPDGQKHGQLLRSAASLGELIGGGLLDRTAVEQALFAAIAPRAADKRNAAKTIRDGIQYGIERPRGLPQDDKDPEIEEAFAKKVIAAGPPEPPPFRPETAAGPAVLSTGDTMNRTDLGNARRLVRLHGHDVHYCHAWSKWLVWDGRRWAPDETEEIVRRAKATVASIYIEASNSDEEERKALAQHALRSEAAARIRSMVDLARSESGIPATPDTLDADPSLLNCLNGTVDLRTGELRPHRREDLVTKVTPVDYAPAAQCPTWEAFLERIMDGNKNLIGFIRRAIGYALTGNTGERVMFILYGSGANGKSTLLEAIRGMLGDYAMRTPTETLMKKPDGAIPNDIARLKGARFVSASESEEGKRLAESLIKDLTGGDMISARFMRAEWFEFRPEFKLFLATNHKPDIRGTDKGIWDRVRLIPFGVCIPENERDRSLGARLDTERAGILAWAVQGCIEWQRNGLGTPDEVRTATEGYRADMDVLAAFLSDCCILNPAAYATAKGLYAAYTTWCEAAGERAMSQTKLGLRLKERGFGDDRGTGGVRLWRGLGLLVSDAL